MAILTSVATTRGHNSSDRVSKRAFGRALAELRAQRGLTQAALARKLGLAGQQSVSSWESGERMPDVMLWPEIAQHLGVSPHRLAAELWGEWDTDDGQRPTIEDYALRIAEMAKEMRDSNRDGE